MSKYNSNTPTIHKWRVTRSPRQRGNALGAIELLHRISKLDKALIPKILNDNTTFYAPFRSMIQSHNDLIDCGYRAYVVPRDDHT